MATFIAIPEKTQSATAMRRVLDYVTQDKKTDYDGINLVGGQNCVPESAYQEFMATKHQYKKANGVFFKQYVQSFKPNCGVTPEQIHQIGLEMAKAFDGFEVLVATHIDRDHWHNHFVVNSVNCETGLKIQIDEKGLEQLRKKSDEICKMYGLETLKPYEKPKQKTISKREYRSALRGNSRKLKLMNAIDYCVAASRTKKQFIDNMKKLGYGIKWMDHYKYITYTTPEGQKFRDNRLLENKYLKNTMEELFAYEYKHFETEQSNTTDNRRNGRHPDRTDATEIFGSDGGSVQQNSGILLDSWIEHCKKHGFDIQSCDLSGLGADNRRQPTSDEHQDGFTEIFSRGQIIQADGILDNPTEQGNIPNDERDEDEGFDSLEAQTEMGRDWSNIAVDSLYLVAYIASIGENNNDKHKPKYIREHKNRQKKNGQSNQDNNDMQMTM